MLSDVILSGQDSCKVSDHVSLGSGRHWFKINGITASCARSMMLQGQLMTTAKGRWGYEVSPRPVRHVTASV